MTNFSGAFKNAVFSLPEFCKSHWLLRIPVATIILQSGLDKFPLSADDAASYELPYLLWVGAAFGELFGAFAIIAGGLVSGWIGDLTSRLGGFTIASILVGVIVTTNWSPIWDILLYDHLHVLLFVGGLYFALRGNGLQRLANNKDRRV